MLYVIDGHNAAGRLGIGKERRFEDALVRKLAGHKPGKAHRYELVMDGHNLRGDEFGERLSVLYSRHGRGFADADDRIVDRVRRALRSGETEIAVVTDDRELGERVRALADPGAVSVIGVSRFFLSGDDGRKGSEEGDRPGLSPAEVARLNEELLREWGGEDQ